jgi:hypothetical protein
MIIELKQKLMGGAISYTKINVKNLNDLITALELRKIKQVTLDMHQFENTLNIETLPIEVSNLTEFHFNWITDNDNREKYLEIFTQNFNYSFRNYKKIS